MVWNVKKNYIGSDLVLILHFAWYFGNFTIQRIFYVDSLKIIKAHVGYWLT